MRAEDLVDAALLGFERGESGTLPSLHDVALWDAYEAARKAMAPRETSASALGAAVIRETLHRSGLAPEAVDTVAMGIAIPAQAVRCRWKLVELSSRNGPVSFSKD